MKNLQSKIIVCASFAAILLVSAQIANSQTSSSYDADSKHFEFGVNFMPTIATFDTKASDGSIINGKGKLGYGGGVNLGYNFSQHVGVQAELLYFAISQKNEEQNITHQVNLHYVNIPLLLSLNTGIMKPVNLNLVFGPQLGVSVGGNVKTSNGDGTNTTEAILDIKGGDLGLAYGAGLDFAINEAHTLRLGLGFRGVYGLIDVSDNNKTTNSNSFLILDKSHIKTYSAYLGMSVLF